MIGRDFFAGYIKKDIDVSVFRSRREALISAIKKQFPGQKGIVLLFAGLEGEVARFRQEKSFYYYTGINEPGTVLAIDLNGTATLYIPNCFKARAQWMALPESLVAMDAQQLGFDAIQLLGKECRGYGIKPFFSREEYAHLLSLIEVTCADNGVVFTTSPDNDFEYLAPRFILLRVAAFIPEVVPKIVDISSLIAAARRRKDAFELDCMYQAVATTIYAHEAAARAVVEGVLECEVQASLEYMMIGAGAQIAFPSIVATGKNSTVLHYTHNDMQLQNGDLVVVDIGAEQGGYCADLTRTYPVSGTFTSRQREVYDIVLATQEYIASIAQPGYWLKNASEPSRSLHHLSLRFLAEYGYDKYFTHGIGHYLGLDVHDVGDYTVPLQEGDVITIEPGIYIPQECIGIRIEDNYVLTKTSVFCLSDELPKVAADIECFVQRELEEENVSGLYDDERHDNDVIH